MKKYDPREFANKLTEKIPGHSIRICPFCGGEEYTTTQNFASFIIGDELSNVCLGPNIPAGMLVCQNCGHIDFFALGALDLLAKDEGDGNGCD